MSILPDKISELIRVALYDLEQCERDDRYRIEMMDWHVPDEVGVEDPVCEVCLAGAVMAKRLGISPHFYAGAGTIQEESHKLTALDALGRGATVEAEICLFLNVGIQPREMASYDENRPEPFKGDLRALADEYEAAGC